jgi:hypothetical protein
MAKEAPSENATAENSQEQENQNEKLETPESTDEYFERVNRRFKAKKKNRFSIGDTNKKAPAPQPVKIKNEATSENKTEPPPAETQPEPTPFEAEKQTQTFETSTVEPAETLTVEQPPIIAASEEATLETVEVESKPQPVTEQVKPKKKWFSFSLHRKKPDKTPALEPQPLPDVTVQETPQIGSVEAEAKETPVALSTEKLQVNPLENEVATDTEQTVGQGVQENASALVEPEVQPETLPVDATVKPVTVETQLEKTLQPEEEPEAVAPFEYSEGVENIGKYTQDMKALLPSKAVLCIGEYPVHLLLKNRFAGKPDGVLPLFIDKSSLDIIKWSPTRLDPNFVIGLDAELDTHFWYNITSSVDDDSKFISRLKEKPIEKLHNALMVASIWDGVGSALLPALINQFNMWKIRSVAVALLPSKLQPLENQFNAFSAVGKCASMDYATLVLLGRDNLESYIGIDRKGHLLDGNVVANYLLDFMLSKEGLVDELGELGKTFDAKLFTLLFGTGSSIKIYGSIENILDIALNKAFLTFNLASTSLVYVLVRMPLNLKDKLTRAKVEMAVANWFKDKATLKSIHVTEPVYVEDANDRIDIALFVGGFDVATLFNGVEKKVGALKNQAVKNGFLTETQWKEIVKNLEKEKEKS